VQVTGLWALVDHLEGVYSENPTVPEEPMARAGPCASSTGR
jgi:hypothetical protein